MFPTDQFALFFLFVIGGLLGFIPPFLWGMNGGDEGLIVEQPHLKGLLNLIHHWQLGVVLVAISGILFYIYGIDIRICVFVLGWGFVTFLDDAFFHSYANYFQRKEVEGYEEH